MQARDARAVPVVDFGRVMLPARRAPAASWTRGRERVRGMVVPVSAEEPPGTSVRVYRVGRRLGVLT